MERKNNRFCIKFTALLACCICFSCSEFLEPKSQSEFIPATANQLNELILSGLISPYDSNKDFTGGFLDVLSDDVGISPYIEPTDPIGDLWYSQPYVTAVFTMFTWQPNYSTMMQKEAYSEYGRIYTTIYNKLVYVNSTLDYVDKVSGSDEMKRYVRAQAHALRAFYYLHLVNIYGIPYNFNKEGPGIPLRTTGAKENRKMTRNTVEEVYNLIISDLQQSIEFFETLEPWYQFRQYRANLPMALLLMARASLYMENWEQAKFYAEKLIKDWDHRFKIKNLNELITDGRTNIHQNAAVNNDDRGRQHFYKDFASYSNSDVIWLYGSVADVTKFSARTLYQSSENSRSRVQKNRTNAVLTLASNSLTNSYAADDLRLRTYFVRSLFHEPDFATSTFDIKDVKYRAYGKLQINDDGTGLPDLQRNRFLPEDNQYTYGQTLRITEAYLILAEAQAMLNNASEALQTLEAIWENRFADGTAPASYKSGSDAIELVRRERRRELCFESLRWFDLRRWGMPQMEHIWFEFRYGVGERYTIAKDDPGYTIPLPHTILEANPDLTQVPLAENGKDRKPE